VDSKQTLWKQFGLAASFGTKPHYQMRQVAPRHFQQTGERAGIGIAAVQSIMDGLRSEALAAIDSVVSDLPREFPDKIASSIVEGVKRRIRILDAPDARS
jgi:serine/threonine-protein kinase HipA